MIRSVRPFAAVALAGALVLGAGSASAQPPQGQGSQASMAQLLHLRPDQMGAYQALQRAGQPTPEEISQLRAASPQTLASLTTPERLDRIGAALAVRSTIFHRTADALRALYAQLTPDQRSTYDRLSAQMQASRGRPSQ